MHTLRIATWNAEGMFVSNSMTKRASPHDAIRTIKMLDADLIVIPEFGVHGTLEQPIRTTLHSLGYEIVELPYEDKTMPNHVPKNYEMAVLSRLPITSRVTNRLGGTRNSVELTATFDGHELRIFGIHLDDKTEASRMAQVKDLARLINGNVETPTLLIGDFNAMAKASQFARLMRSAFARQVTKSISHEQLKSITKRLHDMALGTTLEYLFDQTHLIDFDPGRQHTLSGKQAGLEWMPSIRLAKIDWILGSRHFSVESYKIIKDVGSDHRPVLATVRMK